jgi:hypothetical protein
MDKRSTEENLRQVITDEVFKAIGIAPQVWYRGMLAPWLSFPVRRFVRLATDFDHIVHEHGFSAAARWVLPKFVREVHYEGMEHVPGDGPVLVVSNHPGTVDGLCIAAGLERQDIKIVVSGVPFLRGLPASARYLIYSSLDTHLRMLVVRSVIRQLRAGGAVLIFPSGGLDPDPAVLAGARDAITHWSPSLQIILRNVPQTQVLVTQVGGVLDQRFAHHILTHIRRVPRDRQRVAEFMQTMRQLVWEHQLPLNPLVSFAQPCRVADLTRSGADDSLMPGIIQRAQNLLEDHEKSYARLSLRRA